MHSPDPTIFYEVCNLISAQIDALETPELTPELLLEFRSRSEQIRGLCQQLDVIDRTQLEEQLLDGLETLESVA